MLQAYLKDTADKFGLLPHIQFRTRVVSAEWLEEEASWRVLSSAGEEFLCSVLIHSTGMLHQPSFPNFPGEESFTGQTVHTARWNETIQLRNKVRGIKTRLQTL